MGKFYAGIAEQLELYVRHAAWLHATPKDPEKPAKGAGMTRLVKFKRDEMAGKDPPELIFPEVDAGEYIVDWLFEVGPMIAGDPVTFQEIKAWRDLSGRVLDGWEATTLRRLSIAYTAEYHQASDPRTPAPGKTVAPKSAKQVSEGLAAAFARLERGGRD